MKNPGKKGSAITYVREKKLDEFFMRHAGSGRHLIGSYTLTLAKRFALTAKKRGGKKGGLDYKLYGRGGISDRERAAIRAHREEMIFTFFGGEAFSFFSR